MISLDDVTGASPSAEEFCTKLRMFGVVRVPGFLSPADTKLLLEEAKLATTSFANYRNPYGPCSRFSLHQLLPHLARSRDLIKGDTLDELPADFRHSRELFTAELFRVTTRAYLGPGSGFMEVVAFTRDHVADPEAMYGKLHYDRRHQLKFILYLNDVDQSNGAFGCIPGSHRAGRKLFLQRWREALALQTSDAEEIDAAAAATPEDTRVYASVRCLLDRGEAIAVKRKISIDGPAGTLVAFDTNLLHFGGFVTTPHRERWTLKGHTFATLPVASDRSINRHL